MISRVKLHALVATLLATSAVSLCAQSLVFLDHFGTFGSGSGQFSGAHSVAVSVANPALPVVFVTDSALHRVQAFHLDGTYFYQWGGSGSGNGQFNSPSGIAVNESNGNVYVVDAENDRVQIFNSNGVFLGKFGSTGTGPAQFNSPAAIAIHRTSGRIYIVDTFNHRVQWFDPSGGYLGQWGSLGSGDGQFEEPRAISVHQPSGKVYVSDPHSDRVQRFSPGGVFELAFGGTGINPGQLSNPNGLVVDPSGRVYASEQSWNRVQRFSGGGILQLGFAPQGLSQPLGMAIGPSGILYVVSRGNNRVHRWRIIDPDTIPPKLVYPGKRLKRIAGNRVRLRGRALDNVAIASVRWQDGRGKVRKARLLPSPNPGNRRWVASVRPRPKRNRTLVRLFAHDVAGNRSRVLRVRVVKP